MLPPRTLDWTLHVAPDGGVDVTAPEPVDWPTLMLHADPAGVPADLLRRYPHLDGSLALRLPSGTDPASLVRNQVLVTAHARNGRLAASGDYVAIHFDARARPADYARIREALAGNPQVTFARRRVKCGWRCSRPAAMRR